MKPQRKCPRANIIRIPEDLLHELIFPRLSFKSLTRMKGVSKDYRAMITSCAHFSTLQSLSPSPASTGFVYLEKNGLSFLPDQAAIGVPDPSLKFLAESPKDVELLSSTNGLLLFHLNGGVNSLCICNPATMKTEIVPNTPKEISKQMGLAFNPRVAPSRYAIVDTLQSFAFNGNQMYTFSVFRSEIGKWNHSKKKLYVSDPYCVITRPVYAHGLLYWCCMHYVLWYDPDKDCAETIPIPYSKKADYVSKEVSTINDEIFYLCVTIEAGLEVWKLTSGAKWGRMYKLTMEKLIDVNPHNLYLGLPGREVASNSSILNVNDFVRPLAFDGQSLYVAVKSKKWRGGRDLMMAIKEYMYPRNMEDRLSSLLDDHLDEDYSTFDFDDIDDCESESNSEVDLFCCDVITGQVTNIGSTIPAHPNWRLHHYHNSLVALPPIMTPNI